MSQSPRHPVPPLLQSQKRKGIPLPLLPPLPLHRTATHQEQWAGPAWLLGPRVPRSQLVAPPASVCTHLATAGPKAGLARGKGGAWAPIIRKGKINIEIPAGLTELLQRKLQQVCVLVPQDLLGCSLRCHMEHYR